MFHFENLREFSGVYLGDGAERVPAASPLYGSLHDLPPVLLHVGASEILLDDSVRLHQSVLEAGGTSRLRIYDDVAHCWQMLVPFLPESNDSLREAAAFAVAHLR